MKWDEHNLQAACIRWFAYTYTELWEKKRLFAIPNGGRRDHTTGAMLKAEGVVAGVPDIALMVPRKPYHGMYIEMKTTTGRQSEEQKEFERGCEEDYLYKVVRSFDEFTSTVEEYINREKWK